MPVRDAGAAASPVFAVRTLTVIVPPGAVLTPHARLDTVKFGNPLQPGPDTVSAYRPVPSNKLSSTSTAYEPADGSAQVASVRALNEQPETVVPGGDTTRHS